MDLRVPLVCGTDLGERSKSAFFRLPVIGVQLVLWVGRLLHFFWTSFLDVVHCVWFC